MCLNHLFQDMGAELHEVLWDDVPRKDFSEAIDQLEGRIEELRAALEEERRVVEDLSRRLADKKQQAAWLFERVEVYLHVGDQSNAWRHALDLDRHRETLKSEQKQLKHHQHVCQEKLALIRRLQERLADLQDHSG